MLRQRRKMVKLKTEVEYIRRYLSFQGIPLYIFAPDFQPDGTEYGIATEKKKKTG